VSVREGVSRRELSDQRGAGGRVECMLYVVVVVYANEYMIFDYLLVYVATNSLGFYC